MGDSDLEESGEESDEEWAEGGDLGRRRRLRKDVDMEETRLERKGKGKEKEKVVEKRRMRTKSGVHPDPGAPSIPRTSTLHAWDNYGADKKKRRTKKINGSPPSSDRLKLASSDPSILPCQCP